LNDQCNTAEVTIRLFADDVEKAIHTQNNALIIKDFETFNTNLQQYILSQFKLEGSTNIQFLGFETDADMYVIYLEIKTKGLNDAQLTNELLIDALPKQINITHVKHRNKIKTYTFDAKNLTQKISLCGY
jgi:hypothetical protein